VCVYMCVCACVRDEYVFGCEVSAVLREVGVCACGALRMLSREAGVKMWVSVHVCVCVCA